MHRSLDKSVSSLEMELAVERAKQNGGLGVSVPSRGRLPKAFVVIGINTAFSSKKRRDSLRDTWVPRGTHPHMDRANKPCIRVRA